MSSELQERLDSVKVDDGDDSSVAKLSAIVLGESSNDADAIKVKETALDKLTALLVARKDAPGLAKLLEDLRPLFASIPKAKTAKIVRSVVAAISQVPDTDQLLEGVLTSQVAWATESKRTFLRQRLETRLALLHLRRKEYPKALGLLSRLLTEVKKLDDKLLLVDVFLAESRAHAAVRNLAKARASLTAARAAAAAVYVPPSTQSELDLQSGVLHAEERDYATAYSYFFEAFEALAALGSPEAPRALKLMLLCKVARGDVSDVASIVASKAGLSHAGPDVDAMRAVARAYERRSLEEFQAARESYRPQLGDDPVVAAHLARLYDTMLEQNLIRLIEPFSRVEVAHVAELISLPRAAIESKLSQMILDGAISGTLDQGLGVLEIWEDQADEALYAGVLETLGNVRKAVDILHERSAKLIAGA